MAVIIRKICSCAKGNNTNLKTLEYILFNNQKRIICDTVNDYIQHGRIFL